MGRFVLIAAGFLAAGAMAWVGIARDGAADLARMQDKASQKAAYREAGAIIVCRSHPSLIDASAPPSVTRYAVPAPDRRSADVDLARLDELIDAQNCQVDTDQQSVWAATQATVPVHASGLVVAAFRSGPAAVASRSARGHTRHAS